MQKERFEVPKASLQIIDDLDYARENFSMLWAAFVGVQTSSSTVASVGASNRRDKLFIASLLLSTNIKGPGIVPVPSIF